MLAVAGLVAACATGARADVFNMPPGLTSLQFVTVVVWPCFAEEKAQSDKGELLWNG
jgi:hypothetical protein